MKAALLLALLLILGACAQVESLPEITTASTTEITTAPTTEITTTEATTMPPEETEPINHTITARIHPDMPEFTFTLEGRYKSGIAIISSIEIREVDGPFHQRLDDIETFRRDWESDPYGFSLVDFNDDGYLDIQQVIAAHGVGALTEPSYFWLWDNTQGKFIQNEQLREISESSNIYSVENGRVQTHARAGGMGGAHYNWYEYKNGAFVLVESSSTTFHDEADGIYEHNIHKKLIDGEWQIISDTREKVEQH